MKYEMDKKYPTDKNTKKQEGHDGPASLHWLILEYLFKT